MANIIKKIISEEIERFVINEMLSSKCYHFTTLNGLLRILKTNTFLLKTDVVSDTEHWADKPRQRFFMSTTRVRDGRFGYNNFIDRGDMLVRITLNGDLLNANYKGKPINWQMHSNKIMGYIPNLRSAKSTKSSSISNNSDFESMRIQPFVESEDRIFSNRPTISNADRYIKRIDILTYNSTKDVNAQAMDILQEIPSRFRNITFVYTTMKDFNRQDNNMDNVDRTKVKDTKNPRVDVNLKQKDLKKIGLYAEKIYDFISACDKLFDIYRKKEYGYNLDDVCRFAKKEYKRTMHRIKDLNTVYYNNDKSKQILKNVSDWFVKHNIVNFNDLQSKIQNIYQDNKSKLKG